MEILLDIIAYTSLILSAFTLLFGCTLVLGIFINFCEIKNTYTLGEDFITGCKYLFKGIVNGIVYITIVYLLYSLLLWSFERIS